MVYSIVCCFSLMTRLGVIFGLGYTAAFIFALEAFPEHYVYDRHWVSFYVETFGIVSATCYLPFWRQPPPSGVLAQVGLVHVIGALWSFAAVVYPFLPMYMQIVPCSLAVMPWYWAVEIGAALSMVYFTACIMAPYEFQRRFDEIRQSYIARGIYVPSLPHSWRRRGF